MIWQFACLFAVAAADPVTDRTSAIYQPNPPTTVFTDVDQPARRIRGQAPRTYDEPVSPAAQQPYSPFTQPAVQDPFLMNPGNQLPPYSRQYYGVNGPQPYRFGFTPIFTAGYLGSANTSSPAVGRFQVTEYDAALKYVTPIGDGLIFTSTPWIGGRSWEGPQTPDLPGQVFHGGWNLQLATPLSNNWSVEFGFNPSINTSFQNALTSDAWNLDGMGALYYRASPQWLVIVGAQYWDRVDNIIVPYAGVVWTPDQLWEVRLTSPKAQITYFLGNIGEGAHWLYASAEYHVESYQIGATGYVSQDQIQLSDYRAAVGIRTEGRFFEKFIEGGWVFDRKVRFGHGTPNFDIADTFMVRAGLKF